MRFFYALAAVAVFFIDSEVSPVEAEKSLIKLKPLKGAQVVATPNTNKRFLRQYAEFEDEDSEERIKTGTVVLDTTKKIDDFFWYRDYQQSSRSKADRRSTERKEAFWVVGYEDI
ncbi:hypothetical protein F442_12836 [Phytophthora nicotianae P10297]|uniref:RxLR effector protein n=1 Tax=Phytophthora nicotianae P10297 TaxID=1317064 RepID=W2Z0M2_PHYNI|nr:hypothetical protein F442_12836 [Phytophthora nicotianae P10297]